MAGKSTAVAAPKVNLRKEKAKGGRPTSFLDELADEICSRIVEGESLRSICRGNNMPHISTIFNWFRTQPQFLEQYMRAKEQQADTNQEDIQQLAHDTIKGKIDPQAARVAGDLLKWSSSKLKPKKYGDKLDLTSDGKQLPSPILAFVNPTDDIKEEEKPKEVPENASQYKNESNPLIINDINL
jgi:hypothetical protein